MALTAPARLDTAAARRARGAAGAAEPPLPAACAARVLSVRAVHGAGPRWTGAARGNDANQVAAGAHVCIIRAMDRHQGDAQVQEKACGALRSLAVNNANQVTLVAAEAHVRIIRAMRRACADCW